MCVTLFASQPSVSIETETTQRTCSPGSPALADGARSASRSAAAASSFVCAFPALDLRQQVRVDPDRPPHPVAVREAPAGPRCRRRLVTSTALPVGVERPPRCVSPLICWKKTSAISVLSQTTIITGGIDVLLRRLLRLDLRRTAPSTGSASVARAPSACTVDRLRLRPLVRCSRSPAAGSSVMFRQSRKYFGFGPPDFVLLGLVVEHRQPRDLDDAALDGVDEAEVADQPGERAALRVAAVAEVERRRREVDAGARMPRLALCPTRPELLMRSSPASQTRASSASSSSAFFSSAVSSLLAPWPPSPRRLGFGRQQWCPSSFSTRIGSRSARSPRRSRVKASASPRPCRPPGSSRHPRCARSSARSACQFVTSTLPPFTQVAGTSAARGRTRRSSSPGAPAAAPAAAPCTVRFGQQIRTALGIPRRRGLRPGCRTPR